VAECKRVDEASNFCRWLQFSGVLNILEAHPAGLPLPVDGKALRKQMDAILFECGELYKGGKHDPKYTTSDIAEINRKLDLLAFHIGRAIPSSPPVVTPASPALDAPQDADTPCSVNGSRGEFPPSRVATTASAGEPADPVPLVCRGGVSSTPKEANEGNGHAATAQRCGVPLPCFDINI